MEQLFRDEKIKIPLQTYVAKFCAVLIPITAAVTSLRVAAGSSYSSSDVVLPACNCALLVATLAYLAFAHRWAAPLWLTEMWVTLSLSVLSVIIQVRAAMGPRRTRPLCTRRERGER